MPRNKQTAIFALSLLAILASNDFMCSDRRSGQGMALRADSISACISYCSSMHDAVLADAYAHELASIKVFSRVVVEMVERYDMEGAKILPYTSWTYRTATDNPKVIEFSTHYSTIEAVYEIEGRAWVDRGHAFIEQLERSLVALVNVDIVKVGQ